MENENEQLVVPPESEREKTEEEGQTTSAENEIVSVENAETSGIAAKTAATDNAEDLPKKKGQRDMTEGVIWKQILAFALPILLSNVIQRLYNAVDSIVVGRFVGHEALAAVGSNNSTSTFSCRCFWEYPWARALSSRNTTAQRTMKNSKNPCRPVRFWRLFRA